MLFFLLVVHLFSFLPPSDDLGFYWLAGILVIISNVAFGASWVFYYAFIPTMARDHPDVIEVRQNVGRGLETWADYQFAKDRISNTLSSHSMAIGYGAGVGLLVVAAGVALAMNQTTYSMQLGISITGVWWFCVMFYTWKNLPAQPGLPLKSNTNLFLYSWRRRKSTHFCECFFYCLVVFANEGRYDPTVSLPNPPFFNLSTWLPPCSGQDLASG